MALTQLCKCLRALEDTAALTHEKRWQKIAGDLEPLLHCYALVERLQRNTSPELMDKLAHPLAALMLEPQELAQKRFDSDKWRRLRGWWRGFLDTLESGPAGENSEGNLAKAVHRLFKYRDRVFKENSQKSWHKLRLATIQLEEQLRREEPAQTDQQDGLLQACQSLNESLSTWYWLQAQIPLIKSLRKSPQVQDGNKVMALLDRQLDLINAECHILLEDCREALAGLNSNV